MAVHVQQTQVRLKTVLSSVLHASDDMSIRKYECELRGALHNLESVRLYYKVPGTPTLEAIVFDINPLNTYQQTYDLVSLANQVAGYS